MNKVEEPGNGGAATGANRKTEQLSSVTIRFAGDSGDGMQLTGTQFTKATGVAGNDLMTFPDFPAEIRAPAGTMAGVSGFQIHFASESVFTPGDAVDVLVAMNPAALRANIQDLKQNGILIANSDAFSGKNLSRVQYESNPLEEDSLKQKFQVISAPITTLTRTALEEFEMAQNSIDRCKNFFALGIAYYMFMRDPTTTSDWLEAKFKGKDKLIAANKKALNSGYYYAETVEAIENRYEISAVKFAPGKYRNITGNSAIAIGLVAAGQLANLPVVLGSYPITPASDILHELSRYKHYGVKTFQAEDEIAAAGAALGAAYGGAIGVTTSSGPGITLKMEAINLAVMTELPMVIVNIQRGGPSTGLPTKTEQADLLEVLFGRNSESPLPVVSASSPSDCFYATIEAVRLSLKYMTPVFLLSDGYLANGSEPWKLPAEQELPKLEHRLVKNGVSSDNFQVYARDAETLARAWPVPGTAGFEHRIGGIEKDSLTGNVSYDPDNHENMVHTRANKIAGIAKDIPDQEVFGDSSGDLLIVSWGSTYGAIHAAVAKARAAGKNVSHAHLRYLNPFPANFESIVNSFDRVLVPEMNMGQLSLLIQGRFLKKVIPLNKVKGRPFLISEISSKIDELIS